VKPLAHHGVAITRCEPEGGPLARRLEERGARVVRWAATRLAPPADPRPLERSLGRLTKYDWLVVTSAHGAAAVTARVPARPAALRVAAVGPATAAELEAAGWEVDLVGPGPGREELPALLGRVAVASIGPTTSAALVALGRRPDAEASPSTLDGLVEAVTLALAPPKPEKSRAASAAGARPR
jgi:uroporphyrinogen-III synthase